MVVLILEILEIVIQLPSWLLPRLAIASTQREKKMTCGVRFAENGKKCENLSIL